MQFINNSYSDDNESNDLKKKVLFGLVVLMMFLVSALVLYLVFGRSSKSNTTDNAGLYYDPGSGETVANPPGQTPETYGSQGKEITYLGFSKLLDYGASKFQLEATKLAFENYSKTRGNDIKEVSITVSSIKNGPDGDDLSIVINFDLKINRQEDYQAQLQLHMIRQVKLTLKKGGTNIYESGLVGPSYGEGNAE